MNTTDSAWTVARLERACRKAFRERTTLSEGRLPPADAATAHYYERGPITVKIDSLKVGLQAGLIHELLHTVIGYPVPGFSKQVSELFTIALEQKVDAYINRSPKRIEWWRNQIGRWIEVKTSRR